MIRIRKKPWKARGLATREWRITLATSSFDGDRSSLHGHLQPRDSGFQRVGFVGEAAQFGGLQGFSRSANGGTRAVDDVEDRVRMRLPEVVRRLLLHPS